jgi:5-methylcytosine-specific restriction endonuclease McrA
MVKTKMTIESKNDDKSIFKFKEDLDFFLNLFSISIDQIDSIKAFFDFRDPETKRKEFNNIRQTILRELIKKYGSKCSLAYENLCDEKSGLTIDHIIPLKSNELNKKLRELKGNAGKKAKSESYGSNNIENLAIVCSNCNGHKKHKFLEKEKLNSLLLKRQSNL